MGRKAPKMFRNRNKAATALVAALSVAQPLVAPITITPVVMTVVVAVPVALAVTFDATPAVAQDINCNRIRNPCVYRPDPGMVFQGDAVIPNQIQVTVCHNWWPDLLEPRWWGPTLVYRNWSADLPAQYSQCRVQWVVPGSTITTVPSCPPFFGEYEVSTPPLVQNGATYWFDPQTARRL